MAPDDEIPGDDPLAASTRRAFGRLAEPDAIELAPWSLVHRRGRRRKQLRVATAVAAAVVVLGAGTAVIANTTGSSDHVSVAGHEPSSTTTSTSTTTIAPTTTTAPVVTPTGAVPPGTIPTNTTPATTPSGVPVVQAQDGSWKVALSAEATTVDVGDDFVVTAELTNTGTQPQSTYGVGTWVIACSSATNPSPAELPVSGFPENAILEPGTSKTFAQTFHAQPSFIGSLRCNAGVVRNGDLRTANAGNDVIVQVVAPSAATTTTIAPPATTTSTTAP